MATTAPAPAAAPATQDLKKRLAPTRWPKSGARRAIPRRWIDCASSAGAKGAPPRSCTSGRNAEERPTIERLHAFIAAQGLRPRGAHHEIYLGDPRRGDPSKLKTVLRQPVSEG